MRVLRDEFFIRKDFAFYDSCLHVALSNNLFLAYELLRRYVWRGQSRTIQMNRMRREGLVVSRISQGHLAELMGLKHRQSANKYIAELKRLGWIRIIPDNDHGPAYYVLGELVQSSAGGRHEVFYADAFCQSVVEHLESEAYQEFTYLCSEGQDDPGFSPPEADVVSERRSVLHRTPVAWRVEKVKNYIELNCTEQVSSNPTVSGGATGGFQGEQCGADTKEENIKVENLEVDKGEGLASLAPPLSDGRAEKKDRGGASPVNQISRDVGEHRTLSESGEYPSVPPPPAGPLPKWLKEDIEQKKAVGNGFSHDHVDTPTPQPEKPPSSPSPKKTGGDLQAIIDKASSDSKKRLEAQLQKAKAKEAKLAALGGKPVPVTRKRQLQTLEDHWRTLMKDKFSGVHIAPWEGRERGQVWNLVEKYTGEIVQEALSYLVEQWDEIRTRMLKGRGGVPSVGFLLRFHDVLVVESQLWTEYRRVKKQVDDYYGGDVFKPDPPEPLNSQYKKLRKEMADLGLPT